MNAAKIRDARKSSTIFLVMLSLASGGAMLVGSEAQARERGTTVTTGSGQSASRSVSRSQGNVSSTTTGPNGQTTSRTVARTAANTTATLSGPNGQIATRVTSRTGTGSQTAVSGPNGQTGSIAVSHP